MSSLQKNRLIKIKFFIPELDSDRIIAVALHATEKISALPFYQLKLISLYEIDLNTFLKKSIRVTIKKYGQCRYIHGTIVTAQDLPNDYPLHYHYQVSIQPILWRLDQINDFYIFHQKNIKDLSQFFFKECHLLFYQFKLFKKHKTYSHQTQYNESALNFLSRLFNKEGIFYYINHFKNNSQLVLSDSLEGCHFNNTHIVFETGRYHGPHIYYWQYHHRSFSAEGHTIKVMAKSNVHTIAPGDVFKLINHPKKAMNDDYLVTKVVHYAADHSKLPASKIKVIGYYKNNIECVPLLKSFPLLIQTIIPKIYGIQTAKVLKESNIDTYAHNINGQVRVLFPWDHRKSGSSFISVKQLLADQYCGLQFFPKEGDTVVVTFEQGNPNKPIILGSLYSTAQQHPLKPYVNGLKTYDGHELSFCDKTHHEKITILSAGDIKTFIKGNSNIQIKNNYTSHIKNGAQKITAQKFRVQAYRSIKLNSENGSIKITPNQITLTGLTLSLN